MPLTGFDIDLCPAAAQPGAGKLEYVPIDEIDLTDYDDALLQSTWNQQAALTRADWYEMPYARGTGAWTEDQQDNEQGQYYRVSLSATLAADTTTVRGELDRMKNHRYLLRLTRGTQVLLIGTPEQPLRFESRFESGAEGGDTRAHRVTWTGSILKKSPGYVPVF